MEQVDLAETKRLALIIKNSQYDRLAAFVAEGTKDELAELQKKNLRILFEATKKHKVRYLYVGKGEIAGCEDIDEKGTCWPAMWAIAKKVGFPGSCGNTDQYQCQGSEIAFPEDSYGGWDLKTGTKLTDEETETMKFNRVVTRPRTKNQW